MEGKRNQTADITSLERVFAVLCESERHLQEKKLEDSFKDLLDAVWMKKVSEDAC